MLSFLHQKPWLSALFVFAMLGTAVPQQTLGELYATDASVKGSVVFAGSGTSVLSGSQIEAGAQAATLKLERGGSLLICQGTRLAISASRSGRELLLSLNSGNVEMNYPIGAAADTLLTPDLRLLLPGPGTIHVAVRVAPQGDTCVQSLASNASAIVVSETMGDATYQVKPDEAVLFKSGHISEAARTKQNCGCPVSQPVQMAKVAPPPPPVELKPEPSSAKPLATPPPEQHIAMESPFVFRANDPVPDLSQNVVTLRWENNKLVQMETVVLPPAKARKEKKGGLLNRVGSFFGTLFH